MNSHLIIMPSFLQIRLDTTKKYNKTKLAWVSRLIRHSARKWGGFILQCSWATSY